jgi:cellulose synthase/poly-beta-1,6-N-acetylglucosamine synthase-like glycosyltransferase
MKISVLIPCHNEEQSIQPCIESCLKQTRPPDEIVVVDDGSTDRSAEILEKFGDHIKVITIPHATGNKSYAQEIGLRHITGDIFIATDSDTILDAKFIEIIEHDFANNPNTAAVAGYVKSLKHNWLTACREIDYIITQNLHKRAQSIINFVGVVPGCAAAYNTQTFKKHITFDHDTLTEDLDFTYRFHELNLRVAFNRQAVVYTQDPADLKSYVRQMSRWYAGGWQNIIKHRRLFQKISSALELSLLYIEGLAFPLVLIVLLIFNVQYLLFYVLSYLALIYTIAVYAAIIRRRIDLLIYAPLYSLITLVNAVIFLREGFTRGVVGKQKLVWTHPKRRAITL